MKLLSMIRDAALTAGTTLALLFVSPALAQAQQTVVSYTFAGVSGAPTNTSPGNSASDLVRDNSAPTFYDNAAGNLAPDANSSGWSTANALDLTLYYTFTVTPGPGGASWNKLTFDLANSDSAGINDGPASFAVRSSLDGFASTLLSGSVGAAFAPYTVPANVTTSAPVEYRIYGFGAGTADGLLQIDNVALTRAVPEPSAVTTVCAFGATLGWLALRRRTRASASPLA